MYTSLIDSNSLLNELGNPAWLIIDTRYDLMNKEAGRNAYLEGHIPGAIYLDVHDDLSGPPVTNRGRHPLPTTDAMNELFSRTGITEHTQIIIYDDSFGSFAARLWWMLQYMQHPAAAVLDGGWQAWIANNNPVDNSIKDILPSTFNQQPDTNNVVHIDNVQGHEKIVDSREPGRYRGEFEPIDPVAGHIPGAINRFWKDNLSEQGFFKDKQELKRDFEQLLQEVPAEEAVFYCGSGVTACHNLLTVVHAGLALPKLYAGSWSEWSNTPGKPVATDME